MWGRESTDAAIAKAKWFSGSVVTVELHSSSSSSLVAKRSISFVEELAWATRLSPSSLTSLLQASMVSFLSLAPGYSIMVEITSAVGFSFLQEPLSRACWRSARNLQVESLDVFK